MFESLRQIKDQLICHLISIKESIFPIYPPGIKITAFVAVPFFIGLLVESYSFALLYLCIPIFVALSFRNPKRYPPPQAEGLVLSPADGKLSSICLKEPPAHLGLSLSEKMKCISIFMRFSDVHVNRVPTSGAIVSQHYKRGSFWSAYDGSLSSGSNESHAFRLKTKSDIDIVFVQIAGFFARRIYSNLKDGEEKAVGEVFGMIAFASRMEIYLPKAWSTDHLSVNQIMLAGETVIARELS